MSNAATRYSLSTLSNANPDGFTMTILDDNETAVYSGQYNWETKKCHFPKEAIDNVNDVEIECLNTPRVPPIGVQEYIATVDSEARITARAGDETVHTALLRADTDRITWDTGAV